MEDEAHYRAMAQRCRRLAMTFTTIDDPAHAVILAMAVEFELLALEARLASVSLAIPHLLQDAGGVHSGQTREPESPAQVEDSFNRPGLIMADDKSKAGTADRLRINVHANYELRDWSKKFGVTVDELKEAVYSAGPMADEVERYLNKG
jgi:hypothetical protein